MSAIYCSKSVKSNNTTNSCVQLCSNTVVIDLSTPRLTAVLPYYSQRLLQHQTLSILVCVTALGCLLGAIAINFRLGKRNGQTLLELALFWVC